MISVNSYSFHGELRKSWQAELVMQTAEKIELTGLFDRDIRHNELGLIRKNTISREYYWFAKNYNLFCFFEPNGIFRNLYFNISLPPKLLGRKLEYIDLDIDVVVWPDKSHTVLDLDEFEANDYPENIRTTAFAALADVLSDIESGRYELPRLNP